MTTEKGSGLIIKKVPDPLGKKSRPTMLSNTDDFPELCIYHPQQHSNSSTKNRIIKNFTKFTYQQIYINPIYSIFAIHAFPPPPKKMTKIKNKAENLAAEDNDGRESIPKRWQRTIIVVAIIT